MEPEVSNFLKRIATTMSAILLWMLILILFGLKLGYFFFEDGHRLGSILLYIWIAVSGFFLLRWIIRNWKPFF